MLAPADQLTLKLLAQTPNLVVDWLKASKLATLEALGGCPMDQVAMYRGQLQTLNGIIDAIENGLTRAVANAAASRP